MIKKASILLILLSIYAQPLSAHIVKVNLDGAIDEIHKEFVTDALQRAEREKASLFLITINTPGGFGDAMQELINRLINSTVPVATYVYPSGSRAASAGFFMLLCSDIAAMAPGTHTGSAHPVMSFGGIFPIDDKKEKSEEKPAEKTGEKTEKQPDRDKSQMDIMKEKVEEDILAYLRSIVEKRGRNLELAQKGVKESKSYTDKEALEGNLIDLVAQNEQELLDKLDGRKVKRISGEEVTLSTKGQNIIEITMTPRQEFLSFIASPNVAFLLGILGALLIYVEITHAGLIAPGVIGGLCILISLLGFSFLPVNIVGVLLIIAAFGLFIAEVKIQSFGILGIAGIVSLALGAIMLIDAEIPELQINMWLAISVAVAFGIIIMFLLTIVIKTFRRKAETGQEGLLGMIGEIIVPIQAGKEGKIFVHGETWRAVASKDIPENTKVRIISVGDLILTVEPVSETEK
jgi:membrane-bound serine protease (ClpP class)